MTTHFLLALNLIALGGFMFCVKYGWSYSCYFAPSIANTLTISSHCKHTINLPRPVPTGAGGLLEAMRCICLPLPGTQCRYCSNRWPLSPKAGGWAGRQAAGQPASQASICLPPPQLGWRCRLRPKEDLPPSTGAFRVETRGIGHKRVKRCIVREVKELLFSAGNTCSPADESIPLCSKVKCHSLGLRFPNVQKMNQYQRTQHLNSPSTVVTSVPRKG